MTAVLVGVLLFVVVVGWWIIGNQPRVTDKEVDARWRQAASALGLEYAPGDATSGPMMEGAVGAMRVVIDTFGRYQGGERKTFTRVVVDSLGRIPAHLGADAASRTDDPVERLLQQTSRRRITDLVKHLGATVSGGRLRWACAGLEWDVGALVTTVRNVVRTAEHLCLAETDIPGRLLANVRDHTVPADQRREMLLVLLDRYAGTPEAATAAKEALDHPEPAVRLEAARSLGKAGVPALGSLAADPEAPADIRANALTEVIRNHPRDLAEPQLRKVLKHPDPHVPRTGIHVVRHLKHEPAVRVLLELAADPRTEAELLGLVVELIAELGDASAEPTLLGLLHHKDVVVRRGAAMALGRLGSGAALGPLQELVDAVLTDNRLRSHARGALREIRQRLGLEEAG